MGIVYGVDVGDGAGVRPSTANYDDNGGYAPADATGVYSPQLPVARTTAFEGIVRTQLPISVGAPAGVSPPAVMIAVYTMALLTAGELVSSLTVDLAILDPDQVSVLWTADAALSTEPSVLPDERVVPLETNGFTIPDWYPAAGMPAAVTGMVVESQATATVGALRGLPTYPDPKDVMLPSSLRWIPTDATLDPLNTQWAPYLKTTPTSEGLTVWQLSEKTVAQAAPFTVNELAFGEFIILPNTRDYLYSSAGVNPSYLGEYTYWRGGGYVRSPSLAFRDGDHMWSDAVNWNASEITVLAVAVLHRPSSGWYGVLETEATSEDGVAAFFGLRYETGGSIVLWAGSELLRIPLDTGLTRPSQPVVIGFNIDMLSNTCSLLSVDTVAKVQTTALPNRYDNRSRLWIGRSPHGKQAAANMDLLEYSTFDYRLEEGQLAALLGIYDQMYGVSSS